MFADPALTRQLARQLKMYLSLPFKPLSSRAEHYVLDARFQMLRQTSRMMNVAEQMDEMRIGDENNPKNNRFEYPADQRRTKNTVDRMRHAEIKLDMFWEKVDKKVLTRAKKPWRRSMVIQVHNSCVTTGVVRMLQQTKPLSDAPKQPKATKLSVVDQRFELQLRTQQLSTTRRSQPQSPRAKRRPVVSQSMHSSRRKYRSLRPLVSKQVFVVYKKMYKVFNTLFYSPDSSDRPGEIVWQDFLAAMAVTRSVFEKRYGSVWPFTSIKLHVERAINFHEAHPEEKIPHRMARRHGGRLSRAHS